MTSSFFPSVQAARQAVSEYLLAVKTDVVPLETAGFADPESTVIDGGEQCLVIQVTETDKPSHLFLREYTREPLRFAYLREDESSRFLEAHTFVVVLQSKHGMLEMRDSVAVPVQEHRQIVVNICLRKVVGKFPEIQYGLSNLQTVVVDTAVGILGQTKFFCKQRYTVPEFGNRFNRPVQGVIGHGVLWCRGIMNGGVKNSVISLHLYIERKIELNVIWWAVGAAGL